MLAHFAGIVPVLLFSSTLALAQTDGFRVHNIGVLPGGSSSDGIGINDSGQITGVSGSASGGRAYLYSGGVMINLGVLPGGSFSTGYAINSHGHVTGRSESTTPGPGQAFLHTGGGMVNLGALPGGVGSEGLGINASGVVSGWSESSSGLRAITYSGGTMTSLGVLPGGTFSMGVGINGAGQVTGWSDSTGGTRAFLHSGGTMIDLGLLPGHFASYGSGINSFGQVSGTSYASAAPDGRRAFFHNGATMIDLGVLPGGTFSDSYHGGSVNDLGMVVGRSGSSAGNRAFVWTDATGMVNLNDRVLTAGWTLDDVARGINTHGQITGRGTLSGTGARAYIATPELNWKLAGSGNWDDAGAWSWGLTPADPHPVIINNHGAGTIVIAGTTAANTTISQLHIGTAGTGNAVLQLRGGTTLNVATNVNAAITGIVFLGTNGALSTTGTGTAVLNGPVHLGGGARNIEAVAGTTLRVNGHMHVGGINKIGAGTLELTDGTSNYAGGTTVNDGTLRVNNSSGSATGTGTVTVNNTGTLAGNGIISGNVVVNSGGTLAPGNSPGVLTVGGLTMAAGSTFRAELFGVTVGTQYDRLVVTGGSINLGGATLDAILGGGYVAGPTDKLFLIDNQGAGAVTGTFAGLAQGSGIILGGQTFYITYEADVGSGNLFGGNDVALSPIPEPTTWAMMIITIAAGAWVMRRRVVRCAV